MERFFGEVIKGARLRRGWKMKQLAAAIDRTEGEISKWEGGGRQVNERVILSVARAFDLDLAALFAEEIEARGEFAMNREADELPGYDYNGGFLSDALKHAREGQALSQAEVGRRCKPASPQPRIAGYERGERSSTHPGEMKARDESTIERVASALGLKVIELVTQELIRRDMLRER